MVIYCKGRIENNDEMENIKLCLRLVGGSPEVHNDEIEIDYKGNEENCKVIQEIFEEIPFHTIYTQD